MLSPQISFIPLMDLPLREARKKSIKTVPFALFGFLYDFHMWVGKCQVCFFCEAGHEAAADVAAGGEIFFDGVGNDRYAQGDSIITEFPDQDGDVFLSFLLQSCLCHEMMSLYCLDDDRQCFLKI